MYILKNAIRSIFRSPGRTVIICLIVTAISAACCVALSIQQSAATARINSKNSLQIRGHIKADRQYVMEVLQAANESASASESEEDAAATMEETLKEISGLSLEELRTYTAAPSVQGFYYYSTLSLSGDNGLTPLNQNDHSDVENAISSAMTSAGTQTQQGGPGPGGGPGSGPGAGGPGMGGGTPSPSDIMASINFGGEFLLYGYSGDEAMEDFSSGKCYITSGRMFDENGSDYVCIVNEELATYNSLSVGDRITLSNPAATSERYTFTVVGLYKNTEDSSSGVSQSTDDPANAILTSYPVIADILARSLAFRNPSDVESTVTAEDGTVSEQLLRDDGSLLVKGASAASDEAYESEKALADTVTGTYVFASIDDFDAFEAQAKALGLSDNYTVTSSDVAAYEASLVPLDNLSAYANSFLYIVLGIGAVILIGVNVFNIRERKYEIGALTAMGMRKGKVALQFILELTIVTFLGIAIGSLLGSAVSTPVANELLASQIQYEQASGDKINENFGREVGEGSAKPHGGDVEGEVEYVSTVSFTFDQEIVYKMAVIGALLALVSSAAAITFVLRYNPLEILAERD